MVSGSFAYFVLVSQNSLCCFTLYVKVWPCAACHCLRPLKCHASFAVTCWAVWIIFLNVLPNTSLAQARRGYHNREHSPCIFWPVLLLYRAFFFFFFLVGIRQLWLSCNLSIFLSFSMGMWKKELGGEIRGLEVKRNWLISLSLYFFIFIFLI